MFFSIGNLGFNPEAPEGMQNFYPGRSTMMFDPDGVELLYKVSDFEPNFFRALLVNLVKLSFLAMLGVCASTVLSFPVALLLGFAIFIIGALTPFLSIAVDHYAPDSAARVDQWVIRSIAVSAEWLLGAFGKVNPNGNLVEGKLVSWQLLLRTFFMLGIVWSGLTFLIGYLSFRRKELAIYSGHG